MVVGGTGSSLAKLGFDGVEALDLAQEPAGELGLVFFGFVKFAPNVGPAGNEFDPFALVAVGFVGLVTVALQDAAKVRAVGSQKSGQVFGSTAGVPLVEDVTPSINLVGIGTAEGPKVALLGDAVARLEVFNRGLVSLEIGFLKHFGVEGFVDPKQVVSAKVVNPLALGIAREIHSVAHEEVLLLTIVGLVIAETVGGNLGGKPWSEKAALLERRWQCGDMEAVVLSKEP